ncbi:hypothetical protein M3226_19530 [Neobacillus cucumis]|nr:hypothetical protein [Neobacillus cucumis]MCM3727850.1 hypothetical protein [Neobacillus cucumis]
MSNANKTQKGGLVKVFMANTWFRCSKSAGNTHPICQRWIEEGEKT